MFFLGSYNIVFVLYIIINLDNNIAYRYMYVYQKIMNATVSFKIVKVRIRYDWK